MEIVDANVILRYLLDDNKELADKATEIIESSKVHILNEVLAEVICVLEGVYRLSRNQITEVILEFAKLETVIIKEERVVVQALRKYSEIKLDFVDCLLYAYSKVNDDKVYTFDKKLNREID